MEKLLLPENKAKLTELLNRHVVKGKLSFDELKDGEKLKTLNGSEVIVKVKDGKVQINDATIQTHDVKTSNGVIHSVDSVLNN